MLRMNWLCLTVLTLALGTSAARAQINMQKGKAALDNEEWDTAISWFNKAIDFNPKNPAAYYQRGRAHEGKQQWNKAIADYSKTIQLNNRHADAFSNRGAIFYHVKEDYFQAARDFTRAIDLDENNDRARNLRGEIHVMNRAYEQAKQDFEAALKIKPKQLSTCGPEPAVAELKATRWSSCGRG